MPRKQVRTGTPTEHLRDAVINASNALTKVLRVIESMPGLTDEQIAASYGNLESILRISRQQAVYAAQLRSAIDGAINMTPPANIPAVQSVARVLAPQQERIASENYRRSAIKDEDPDVDFIDD